MFLKSTEGSMNNEDVRSRVKKQYTDWPFPKPIPDIDKWKADGGGSALNVPQDHSFLWPEQPFTSNKSILVAGCGTMEAALTAYENPHASVTGIDLSLTSLDYQQKLKKKHNLDNLELLEMDLNDAAQLGCKFDLIICTGVLHHLENPQKGLSALAEVLKEDGVIFAMVYNSNLRNGVFMVRDALRLMNVEQTPEDIAFAREALEAVPSWHPAYPLIRCMDDLDTDAGLVDAVLHRQERGYSVPEILDLAERSNLHFQGWFDNLTYYPEGGLQYSSSVSRRVLALPDAEQWKVIELLVSVPTDHVFLLRRKTSSPSLFRPDFSAPSFFNAVPVPRRTLKISLNEYGTTELRRENRLWKFCDAEQMLLSAADGTTSIGDIIANRLRSVPDAEEKARNFFRLMWRLGHYAITRG
jgi:SAM-dependent methyltransferase